MGGRERAYVPSLTNTFECAQSPSLSLWVFQTRGGCNGLLGSAHCRKSHAANLHLVAATAARDVSIAGARNTRRHARRERFTPTQSSWNPCTLVVMMKYPYRCATSRAISRRLGLAILLRDHFIALFGNNVTVPSARRSRADFFRSAEQSSAGYLAAASMLLLSYTLNGPISTRRPC
jgi:hypothetical protein